MKTNRLVRLEHAMGLRIGTPLTTVEASALLASIPFAEWKAIFVEEPGSIDWGGRHWWEMSDADQAAFVFTARPDLYELARTRLEGSAVDSAEEMEREIKEVEAFIAAIEEETDEE